jgi:hypothetical protein
MDPGSVMQVLEEVSRLDSAAGWNVQLWTGIGPFFACFSMTALRRSRVKAPT